MIQPTININGTSREEHIELRRKALDAINAALAALRPLAPNGRDYPGDWDRCEADRKVHFERLVALNVLADEIMREAIAIQRGADQ